MNPDLAALRRDAGVGLNIGCGGVPKPGVVNCDLYHPGADKKLDALDLSEYPDGSVGLIEHHHLIEHLEFREAVRGIKEWHRALRQGGHLVVSCPDMETILRLAFHCHEASMDVFDNVMTMIFGVQDGPGQIHKSGYSVPYLSRILESYGFDIISTHRGFPPRPTPSFLIVARKR